MWTIGHLWTLQPFCSPSIEDNYLYYSGRIREALRKISASKVKPTQPAPCLKSSTDQTVMGVCFVLRINILLGRLYQLARVSFQHRLCLVHCSPKSVSGSSEGLSHLFHCMTSLQCYDRWHRVSSCYRPETRNSKNRCTSEPELVILHFLMREDRVHITHPAPWNTTVVVVGEQDSKG